jgi:hypothetical protein
MQPYHTFLYRICGFISLFFLGYVGFGYYLGFAVWFPAWPSVVRLAMAVIITGVVFYLLLHFAAAIHRSRSLKRGRFGSWVLWYLGLFVFSGMGFLLASMLLFEGPVVMRENMDAAIRQVNRLESAADTLLPVPAYTDAVERLQRDRTNLHQEIVNAISCGVGDYAKNIIQNIRVYAPEFPILRDSDKRYNCADTRQRQQVEQIADQYDRQVQAVINGLPGMAQFVIYHIPEREELKNEIHRTLGSDLANLEAEKGELAGVWSFFPRMDLYYRAIGSLEHAADHYNGGYQRLAGLVGQSKVTDLAPTLDVSSAENIASPPSLIPNVAARIGSRWQVAMYLFVALIADLLVGYLWSAAILVLERRPSRAASDRRIPDTDVRYLWVSPAEKT